jgi:hypothetical protein
MRVKRASWVCLVSAIVMVLSALPSVPEAEATLAWPHFLEISITKRRGDTRVIIEAAYKGMKWTSQPGVATGKYLVRVDSTGFLRSIDGKLTFWRTAIPSANALNVLIANPGANGTDRFPFTPGNTLGVGSPSYASGPGNSVKDTDPNTDRASYPDGPNAPYVRPPMDFEIFIGKKCQANMYIQFTAAFGNRSFGSAPGPGAPPYGNTPIPGSTNAGFYRVRLNADLSVSSLDGKLAFHELPLAPQDRGQQDLGVLIVHSCDPAGDGADIVGWDHVGNGALRKQTTFAEAPPFDAGYGWQKYNSIASEARESFASCNYIVLTTRDPAEPPSDNTSVCNAGPLPEPPRPTQPPPPPTTRPPRVTTPPPPSATTTPPPITTLPPLQPTTTLPGGGGGGAAFTPTLVLDPPIGPSGFVSRAIGSGFPPNAPLALLWLPGLGAARVTTDAAGNFTTMVLVLEGDTEGPRKLQAGSNGSLLAETSFLVVPGSYQPASVGAELQLFRR